MSTYLIYLFLFTCKCGVCVCSNVCVDVFWRSEVLFMGYVQFSVIWIQNIRHRCRNITQINQETCCFFGTITRCSLSFSSIFFQASLETGNVTSLQPKLKSSIKYSRRRWQIFQKSCSHGNNVQNSPNFVEIFYMFCCLSTCVWLRIIA